MEFYLNQLTQKNNEKMDCSIHNIYVGKPCRNDGFSLHTDKIFLVLGSRFVNYRSYSK